MENLRPHSLQKIMFFVIILLHLPPLTHFHLKMVQTAKLLFCSFIVVLVKLSIELLIVPSH